MRVVGWWRRSPALATIALFLAIFVIHLASRIPQIGDSRLSAAVAWQVWHHGNLDLTDVPATRGLSGPQDILRSGRNLVPFFPWPPMLLMLPAVALASLINRSTDPSFLYPPTVVRLELTTAAMVVAGTALLLRRYLQERDPSRAGRRTALVAALVFAFGTSAWSIGSRALWQQTVSMLLLAAALLACGRLERDGGRRWAFALGALLAAAAICRPTDAVMAVAIVGWSVFRGRRMLPAALTGAGALVVLIPFLLVSKAAYGAWLPPYYLPSRLSDPRRYGFLESLGVNMISPARGLLIYDPILILAIVSTVVAIRRRTLSSLSVVLWCTVLVQWLIIARFGSTGGWTYGPRLMLDVVPMLIVLAAPQLGVWANAPWRARLRGTALGVTVLVLFSVGINASGATLAAAQCWNPDPVSVDIAPGRVWSWSDAQFLRPANRLLQGHSLAEVRGVCIIPPQPSGG